MLSPFIVKVIGALPESLVAKIAKMVVNNYIKKYANITVNGIEKIDDVKKPRIFVCNHLSNSDGLVLDKVLKEKSDPYFIAGAKLSNDPTTNLGTMIVKNIQIKPNSADKEAITKIVKALRSGEDVVIFPEGPEKYNHIVNQFQDGFVDIARLYYRRTGKLLKFVPLYIAPKLKKAYLGKPIRFSPELSGKRERSRICEYLMQEISGIAFSLPQHTVIPYSNIPKSKYPTNIPCEVDEKHEKTSC